MAALPDETHVGRVALDVENNDRVASVYEDAVGLHVLTRGDDRTVLGDGDVPLLELTTTPEQNPRPQDAAGLFHVAYRVPDRAALADALDRIRESGRMTGASDHLVSEALYLDDPENNGIEVYCDRPREAWDRPSEGTIRMDTLPLDLEDLATEGTGARTVPPGTDVGHVHLEVTDIDRSREFYVETLGFDVNWRMRDALFVSAGGYHHHVGMNTWNRRSAPASGRGLDWFELVFPDEATRAAAVDRLEAADRSVESLDGSVAVEDPDGIEVRLAVRS